MQATLNQMRIPSAEPSMVAPLRVLIIEDSADDADLLVARLSGQRPLAHRRVDHADATRAALAAADWDIVLADHNMPGYSAIEALGIVREWSRADATRAELPFIVVSGAIGEDAAVEAIKAGADDYVIKDNLQRLLPAIERAIGAARERGQHRQAQLALAESEQRFRAITGNLPSLIFQARTRGHGRVALSYVSEGCHDLLGIAPQTLQDNPSLFYGLIVEEDRPGLLDSLESSLLNLHPCNWEGCIRTGQMQPAEIKWINLRASVRKLDGGEIIFEGIVSNITFSKKVEQDLIRSRQELSELSAHTITLKERERARLAREIHDDLGGTLTAIKIDLLWLAGKLEPTQASLLEKTKILETLTNRAIESAVRIAHNLRPGILDYGLVPAIEWQAEEFQKRMSIPCKVDIDDDITLASDAAAALFRVFQETLTNVSKHARATQVNVKLSADRGCVTLSVCDNGCGMTSAAQRKPRSFGLRGIFERVDFLGGSVNIDSAPGCGMSLSVTLPLNADGSGDMLHLPEQQTLF